MSARDLAYLTLVLILVSACSTTQQSDRTAIDSVMAEIFVELHLVQARQSLDLPPSGLTRDSIIAHHGMTRDEFDEQMAYYAAHPAAFSALQNEITDRLGQQIHTYRTY